MWIQTFPMGISPKVNVIVLLEFELTYFEVGTPDITHTLPCSNAFKFLKQTKTVRIRNDTVTHISYNN